jgi:hypothetical protein
MAAVVMDTQFKSQVVFHLTGRRPGAEPAMAGLRPALLAAYRNLDGLRHDFPLVFVDRAGADGAYVKSLSSIMDELLRGVAPEGVKGEGLRRRVLGIEREIRRAVARGARGRLTQLWDDVVNALAVPADDTYLRDMGRARAALAVDGEVAGCDEKLPERFIRHAWSMAQREKARRGRERIDGLVIRLGDILRADFQRSREALQKPALQASFGSAHRGMFDFEAMSRLLSRGEVKGGLSPLRRARVESALAALKAQRFFGPDGAVGAPGFHDFVYDSPAAALDSYRHRLPELVTVLKALQVAELEVEGAYAEDLHDAILAALDAQSVALRDLEFFPDYLVCLAAGGADGGGTAGLAEALSSGVPLKIVAQVGDLLEEAAVGQGRFAFGLRSAQLASAAMSLNDVFVLQSTASNMLQMRDRIRRGMLYSGPALFSIYAAPAGGKDALPGYLASAAAMQSRAFPAFSYDPEAGAEFVERFSLENNPQPAVDWPVEQLAYADQDLQSVTEDLAFTFVEFVACDPRHARHFVQVPRSDWGDGMIPVQQWLASPPADAATGVPFVLAVDDGDLLCRLVVDERLVRAAQRCRESWHRLQELAGVRDSRTERLLARERQAWEEEHRKELAAAAAAGTATATVAAVATTAAPAAAAASAVAEPEPVRNPDEPYIETARCSTCNECTLVNNRMFAYNDNQQAYIADLKAGTYAQMVQAAESCQLSIIHPGKPWNPGEPGLEELVERAKPFM